MSRLSTCKRKRDNPGMAQHGMESEWANACFQKCSLHWHPIDWGLPTFMTCRWTSFEVTLYLALVPRECCKVVTQITCERCQVGELVLHISACSLDNLQVPVDLARLCLSYASATVLITLHIYVKPNYYHPSPVHYPGWRIPQMSDGRWLCTSRWGFGQAIVSIGSFIMVKVMSYRFFMTWRLSCSQNFMAELKLSLS